MTLLRSVTEPILLTGSSWRPFKKDRRTTSAVQFDRQLETVVSWIEKWDHQERCAVLDLLLSDSDLTQIKFLWTVIQPALHRDFMYTAKTEFPRLQFVPISTFAGRKMKERLARRRADNYHRINSAHLQWKEQLHDVIQEVKLPEIVSPTVTSSATWCAKDVKQTVLKPRLHRSVTWGCTENNGRRHEERKATTSSDDHRTGALPIAFSTILRSGKNKNDTKKKLKKRSPTVSLEGQALLHWYKDVWDDSQRNEFLQRILLKLDPRQHYYVSGLLCVKQYKDFISYLPEKISLKILSYLSPKELLRASTVCQRWYTLCSNNEIWHRKCVERNIRKPSDALSSTENNPNWKKIYLENKNTAANWNDGKCSVIHCKGHTDRVLCVTFYENLMATGSVDKTIQIWHLDTGNCIQKLTGHFRGVWCVKFFTRHLLISGSYDCAIKMWNLREQSCVRTLLGHEGPVWAVVQKRSRLASGSQDRTARIWDANRCLLLHTLRGHHGAVYCIDMDDDAKYVVTGSSDKTVRLWSVDSGLQCRLLHVTDRSAIMAISYSNGYMACSFGGKILLYKHSLKNNKLKAVGTYHEHRERIESLLLIMKPGHFQGKIISGGRDGELKYWTVTREKSIQTYRGHNKTINCVYCDEFRIATASYDNKVKIWDFRAS